MSGFSAIELDKLPAPDVVEALDFETILAEMKADLLTRDPSLADVLALESEPLNKQLEVFAYRELNLRQRVNEAAKANMLAYSRGADLDNLAGFFSVERLLISPADPDATPPVAAVYEDNDRFRNRVPLSLEGHSTAGPRGSYIYWGATASANVKDIDASSPTKGDVFVTLLSAVGDGTADQALIDLVDAQLNSEEIRPLNDTVVVQSATITTYSVDADLTLYEGPDSAVVLQAAQAAVEKYVGDRHKLGQDVVRSGIFAALHQPGVQNVVLNAPAADLVITDTEAAWCSGITISNAGTGE